MARWEWKQVGRGKLPVFDCGVGVLPFVTALLSKVRESFELLGESMDIRVCAA